MKLYFHIKWIGYIIRYQYIVHLKIHVYVLPQWEVRKHHVHCPDRWYWGILQNPEPQTHRAVELCSSISPSVSITGVNGAAQLFTHHKPLFYFSSCIFLYLLCFTFVITVSFVFSGRRLAAITLVLIPMTEPLFDHQDLHTQVLFTYNWTNNSVSEFCTCLLYFTLLWSKATPKKLPLSFCS